MIFQEFAKIARLNRDCVIAEKIDGTNAQVEIVAPDDPGNVDGPWAKAVAARRDLGLVMFAGSRSRYITPRDDNFGFAAWVQANADALFALGAGRHYGEWWGSGVQRGYGLQKGDKRFSLFNVTRWSDGVERPACCGVVPTLYRGPFSTAAVDEQVTRLRDGGSVAAPGFMRPEGIVVFHVAASQLFKVTLEKDEQPKGKAA